MLQFYPSSDDQIQLITSIAQKAGFGGGIVVDYPNSNKAKKVFLVLLVGSGGQVPKGIDGDENAVQDDTKAQFEKRREKARVRKSSKKKNVVDKDWILKKKTVRPLQLPDGFLDFDSQLLFSYTGNVERRACLETPSSPVGNGRLCFRVFIFYCITSARRDLCILQLLLRDHSE